MQRTTATKHDPATEVTSVAESQDDIHWKLPDLGIYQVRGTKHNNVVLTRSRPHVLLAACVTTPSPWRS